MLQSPVGDMIGSDEPVDCMHMQLHSAFEVLPYENCGLSALFLEANMFPFFSCVITSTPLIWDRV